MKRSISLSHTKQSPFLALQRISSSGSRTHWIFLGQDYCCFLRWQERLSENYIHVPIKDDLSKVVRSLRKPFLDLIAELGSRYDSVAWWGSRVSERNTMVSSLFLYCCYLKVFEQRLQLLDGNVFVVAEDWAVLDSIAQIAWDQNIEVKWVGHCPLFVRKVSSWVKAVGRSVKFIFRGIKSKMVGRGVQSSVLNKPVVLIQTYVEENCFDSCGTFKDSYFTGLVAWFEGRSQTVVTIPVLFNLKRSLFSAWHWFKKSRQNFLNPYFYYHWRDYVFALKASWEQRLMPCIGIKLQGLDVRRLFEAERDRFLFGCLDNLLYYRLPLRLKEAGIGIKQMIMPFENMIDEKMLVLGFRRFYPQVKTCGFQHSIIYSSILCQFISEEEARIAPYPDRIVSNGEFFRRIMIEGGIPEKRIVNGPALRYGYLWQWQTADKISQDQKVDILVALPIIEGNVMEMLVKVLKAFGSMSDVNVFLKLHPMMSKEFLKQCSLIKSMPAHFRVIEGKMSEWIFKAKLVVSLGSSAIYEALAAGVPVLVIGREHGLDFNPLDFYPKLNHVFLDPEHIRTEALRLLMSNPDRQEYVDDAKEILRMSFQPITDETMQAFVMTKLS